MTRAIGVFDPTDVAALQRAIDAHDPDRRLERIGMHRVEIGPNAIDTLVDIVRDVAGDRPAVVLMVDETPMLRGHQDLKASVAETLLGVFDTTTCVIRGDAAELHTDENAVSAAVAELHERACVVTVGSGTITDIGKEASRRAGVTHVVVQTAASVNAFSDNMAVMMRDGVKRTVESRWPDALIVDLGVLASAPTPMNRAGFGDLHALWTAPADWRLAGTLGMDPSYHPTAVEMMLKEGENLLERAAGLAQNAQDSLHALATLLTLSGIALGVAGSTAPLSGTEHLVSHLIDMRAVATGEPLRLHGAQVGLAAVIASALWRRFLAEGPGALLNSEAPDSDMVHERVLSAFADLDPSGAIGVECWKDCEHKLARWREADRGRLATVQAWKAFRDEVTGRLRTPEELLEALRESGSVSQFADLDPAVSPEALRWAVERLPFMRRRFTLADAFYYGGLWTDELIDDLFVELDELEIV